jgi:NAD+ kinase
MNILIYGRKFGKHFNGIAIQIFEFLKDNNVNLYFNEGFYKFICEKTMYIPKCEGVYNKDIPYDIDIALCIGGDGTFLETATYTYKTDVPILGINSGRLGFLSTVGHASMIKYLQKIIEKDFFVEERIMLELESPKGLYGNWNFALNDFTVQKHKMLQMIKTKISCNGEYLNTYWSDGIIISTPTGSTAYSMSCNGPILIPGTNCFVITPIANHNLTVRPIVVPSNSEIELHIDGHEQEILTSLDYRTRTIKSTNLLRIKLSNFKVKIVRFQENNYFSTLREKLMWGIDVRN